MTREELQLYFENFIFRNHDHVTSDKSIKALDRLINANVYFCEHPEVSYFKVCEMMLKCQDMLFLILPPSNNPERDKEMGKMNELVKMCKEQMEILKT